MNTSDAEGRLAQIRASVNDVFEFPTVREQVEARLTDAIRGGVLGKQLILAVVDTPEGMPYACGTCGWLAPGYGDDAMQKVRTHRRSHHSW